MNAPKQKTPIKAASKARVLIVDDHPMMREGIAQVVNLQPDLVVCGQAGSATEALEAIRTNRPDILLTDISLPGITGLELIRSVASLAPDLPILVISMHEESLYAERALRAGARGYVSKLEAGEKLLHAIRTVIRGEVYVSDRTTSRLLRSFSDRPTRVRQPSCSDLTEREFEVVSWIGQGLTTKRIAARLKISAKTVEAHRVNVKRKLGLGTTGELSVYAARLAADSDGKSGADRP